MTVENGGNGGRLESLDALRGFDMIWITGLSGLVATIGLQLPGGEASWLFRQMCHVEWNGLHFIDTIYPLFIFIAGIAFPFSFARQRERGDSSLRMHLKVLKRAALLVVLGLVYNGSLNGEAWPFRWASVLGRIGLTWMLAAFVYMHTGVRTRLLLVAALLAGYWAVLQNCVSPIAPAGASPLSLEGCFMGYLDTFLTPGTFWEKGIFEPSGVPMSVVSVGTALLGMTAGDSAGGALDARTQGGGPAVRRDRPAGGRAVRLAFDAGEQEAVDAELHALRRRILVPRLRAFLLADRREGTEGLGDAVQVGGDERDRALHDAGARADGGRLDASHRLVRGTRADGGA